MRQAEDQKTPDLLGDSCDLAGPVPPKPTKQERIAARAAKFKARHGVKALTINIPADLHARFEAWAAAKGQRKSDVIAKLIESQLLRKR